MWIVWILLLPKIECPVQKLYAFLKISKEKCIRVEIQNLDKFWTLIHIWYMIYLIELKKKAGLCKCPKVGQAGPSTQDANPGEPSEEQDDASSEAETSASNVESEQGRVMTPGDIFTKKITNIYTNLKGITI